MSKKTYAEQLKLYNSRMANFKTKFTREELYNYGTAQGIRLIPQLLRLWLILNLNKFVDIDEMLDNYAQFENEKNKNSWCPLLQNIKRELCNDKQKANKEIEDTITQLSKGRFHFYHLSAIEQLYVYGPDGIDPMRMFTEDIGIIKWNAYTLISALRTLQYWLKKAPKYEYSAELFERIQDEF